MFAARLAFAAFLEVLMGSAGEGRDQRKRSR